ncbi:MAG: DUF4097 domain-containing protein [Actinomycetota bacterium]|nr:DUF4097 domain-containing protein [Actinomycetota bacterium]
MAGQWTIERPRRLDVGDEGERVGSATISVIAGSVDVVTHDDDALAHLDIRRIEGDPLRVRWDGSRLTISHESLTRDGVAGALKDLANGSGLTRRHRVELTLSVPASAAVSVRTVSANTLASGQRARLELRTVSGDLVLNDIHAPMVLTTVSGDTEGEGLRGDLRVKTVSGDVTVRSSALPTLSVGTTSGNLAFDLTVGRSTVRTNSVSGDVTLGVPSGTGYAVSSRSVSGTVVVDGDLVSGGGAGRAGTARGGDRELDIAARSVSGDVIVLTAAATGLTDGVP